MMIKERIFLWEGVCLASLFLSGCTVGPDYVRPTAEVPSSYKEDGTWKQARPTDDAIRGKWWEIYHDPQLNALEEQVNISNQNIIQAEANFRQAAGAVSEAKADFFPTITANPSYVESQTINLKNGNSGSGLGGSGGSSSNRVSGSYGLPIQATYLADIWGSVRRNVEANSTSAQASFADLENARLSYQAELAQDYFAIQGLDAQKHLLEQTVVSYEKYVQLTTNRYNAGVNSKEDVAQAQTQLKTAQAQLIELGVQRAQFEHAIATLIGKPAPLYSMKDHPLSQTPPKIPAGVPSTLLERRPDIAAAERRVASANATIGVQVAAYYPQITLGANTGVNAIQLSQVFSGPTFFWSVGPAVAQTLFDAGRTHAKVQEARAAYEGTVAAYRQTTLTAFQQVEDALSGLRILESESGVQDEAVKAALQSLDISTNQYKAGVKDYLLVITAQNAALSNQVTAVNLRTRRMTTSVLLIEALGGGWNAAELPGKKEVANVAQAQQQVDKNKK